MTSAVLGRLMVPGHRPTGWLLPLLVAGVVALGHALLVIGVPGHAMGLSYLVMAACPLVACVACWRASRRSSTGEEARAWRLTALALLLWTLGLAANARHDLVLADSSPSPGDSTLLGVLYAVPLTLIIANAWRDRRSRLANVVDIALAVALGALYVVMTFAHASVAGTTEVERVNVLVRTFDIENVFLFVGMTLRWVAATGAQEARYFRVLSLFAATLMVACAINNHRASEQDFGQWTDIIIPVAFVVMAAQLLEKSPATQPNPASWTRYLRIASAMVMALALLTLSLLLIRIRYAEGVVGILVAVFGHGLRTTLVEARHLDTEGMLLRDRRSLKELVLKDALTGVPNRRAFDQALDSEWARTIRSGESVGLLMIDIDYFKRLNDRYGHAEGDDCLRRVAQALHGLLHRPADLVARYGGEEFVALLPGVDHVGLLHLAESLRAGVARLQIENADSPHRDVTVSLGAVLVQPAKSNAQDALRLADEALYKAKRAGRNRVEPAIA